MTSAGRAPAPACRVGVASTRITPDRPMWAAGYAHRDRPVSETLAELYAKALALEDRRGKRLLIITSDLLGLPPAMAEPLAGEISRRFGLVRAGVLLTCSHTHSGPVLRDSLVDIYPMDAGQRAEVERFSACLTERLTELAGRAIEDLAPARLSFGWGQAGFGVNRREHVPGQGVVIGENPAGPVDPDVPVLAITSPGGALRAVLFGYACHNTTLDGYAWCGDYAGLAQADIEAAHPGATAMFVAGCGADINPVPRRTVESCRLHGRALADAVGHVLGGEMASVDGPFAAGMARVDLPFDEPAGRADLERLVRGGEPFERKWAARRLVDLNAAPAPAPPYPYPIQAIRFGHELVMVALAAEVVVEYALRIRQTLGPAGTWVIAYANELFAYLPTRRILAEGGYEADTSVAVYDLPARWSPGIEERIIATACSLARQVATAS